MKKVVIVVANGRVETVFLPKECEDLNIELCDFDSTNEEEQEKLGDYCDECRKTMREAVC